MKEQLQMLMYRQMNHFFLEMSAEEAAVLGLHFEEGYGRALACIGRIQLKYFDTFRLYHTGQYAMLLYYTGNSLSCAGNPFGLGDRLYALNKALHGLDVHHAVCLPDTFYWEHPVGTVLGHARYGENLIVYQGCTVGGVHDAEGNAHYPVLGNRVTLYSHASVIGSCDIGDDVVIAAHARVVNQAVPSGSLVIGSSPNLIFKENRKPLKIFRME